MRRAVAVRIGSCLGVLTLFVSLSDQSGQGRATPGSGYHHLGVTTAGTWSSVVGRMTVTAAGVRKGSYDFVASRFMAKSDTPTGVKWLEAGWAQTGWTGAGRQRVYTFDTSTNKWTFYDQYPISDGDHIWIEITAAGPGPTWVAWLLWRGHWRRLTETVLPAGGQAQLEQYVEVYVDPSRGGTVWVPAIQVDNVQVRAQPGAPLRYWTSSTVPTAPDAPGTAPYCVTWESGYDAWHAGSC